MHLLLVRHGQSANNASYAAHLADGGTSGWRGYGGRVPDPALTALGARQAQALAAALQAGRLPVRPTHLYSSLPLRAVQTAAPLSEGLGLPVVLRDDLHEVGGLFRVDPATGIRHAVPGHSVRELLEHCPRAVTAPGSVLAADHTAPWSGGSEAEDDALGRASALLASLRAAHGPADVVCLVTHQYFTQFVLASLLRLGGPPWQRFRVDNTAHVWLDLRGPHPEICWVNRADHLAPSDVTN